MLLGHRSFTLRYQAERPVDHVQSTAVDDIGSEGVNVDRVLRPHHFPSARSVEDVHFVRSEIHFELFVALRVTRYLQILGLFQDSVTFGRIYGRGKGVQAEVDRFVDLLLCELPMGIGSSLDDYNASTISGDGRQSALFS